eukprot:7026865-Pyramimonas_sp.AAC.1
MHSGDAGDEAQEASEARAQSTAEAEKSHQERGPIHRGPFPLSRVLRQSASFLQKGALAAAH